MWRARGVDQLSRATWARVPAPAGSNSSPGRFGLEYGGPQGRQAVPGNSGLYPWARGVDHLPWATQARVRGPAWTTSTPGPLALR